MSKEARLDRLSELRRSLGLDAMLVTTPANLHYFSGFRTTLYTRFNGLLVAGEAKPVLITSYVDEQLAKLQIWGPVWVRDVRIHGPIQRPDVVAHHLDTLKPELTRIRRLGVDAISLSLCRELEQAFPGLAIEDVSAPIAALRKRKDPEEIENIRRACAIAIECMERAREVLAMPGVTEIDLGAELEMRARKLGADGYGYPILISTGEKIAAPHAPPLPKPIAADVPFVRIAFAPTYDGYCSSIIRTYCRQPATPATTRYAAAFFEAMKAIEAMLKPGATVQDILRTVERAYERAGLRDRWGGDMGYSLGITVHETPRIGGTDNTAMEAGMALAIMPGLRKAGEATFHHADVYAVTETGCSLLSPGLQEVVTYG